MQAISIICETFEFTSFDILVHWSLCDGGWYSFGWLLLTPLDFRVSIAMAFMSLGNFAAFTVLVVVGFGQL